MTECILTTDVAIVALDTIPTSFAEVLAILDQHPAAERAQIRATLVVDDTSSDDPFYAEMDLCHWQLTKVNGVWLPTVVENLCPSDVDLPDEVCAQALARVFGQVGPELSKSMRLISSDLEPSKVFSVHPVMHQDAENIIYIPSRCYNKAKRDLKRIGYVFK